eukprot:Rhum_TRINITY_DN3813_c0_g1::Rhum_TRINITY_DN3813_c0_g1_i1::g.12133::m.12133
MVNRNSVNQGVALVVFMLLCGYAYQHEMLLKPDPAVPFKGAPPRKERSENMFLFPTFPAVYLSAESSDALQTVYAADRQALALVRRMGQKYQRQNAAPAKAMQPILIDVGSPYGSFGVFTAACGFQTLLMQPMTSKPDYTRVALHFNRLHALTAKHISRLLSNHTMLLTLDQPTNEWIKAEGSGKHLVTTGTLAESLGSQSAQTFMVHSGIDGGRPLPVLAAVAGYPVRPKSVLIDVVLGAGRSVDYTLPLPKDSDAKESGAAAIAAITQHLVTLTRSRPDPDDPTAKLPGHALFVLRSAGCELEAAATCAHPVELMGVQPACRVEPTEAVLAAFASDLVVRSHARTGGGGTCRVLLMDEHEFTRTEWPVLWIAAAVLKLTCVLGFFLRKRRKSAARNL